MDNKKTKPAPNKVLVTDKPGSIPSIPINEVPAGDLLALIVAPPLENRRIKLITDVGQRLKDLEREKRLDLNELAGNQQFIDTVMQATTYALKTGEEEKIIAFKNAIINTALGESPDSVVSQIFLNLIDAFTTWHIKILNLFNDPEYWFKANNRTIPNYVAAGLSTVVIDAYPELKGQRELMNIIWGDLNRAGLHNSGDLSTTMSGSGLLSQRTTDMGRKFLRYINEIG